MIDFDSLRPKKSVPPEQLRDGSVYFTVTYVDELLLVPRLDALVFIGHNLGEEDERELYFQDAASYAVGVRLGDETIPEGAYIISGPPDVVKVMEFDDAMEALAKCQLRRSKAAPLVQGK